MFLYERAPSLQIYGHVRDPAMIALLRQSTVVAIVLSRQGTVATIVLPR
jgi:hypothetical protein